MSAQEEIGETQGTNDGNNEGQKPQEGEPPGEIAEEPTQVLDQDGAGDDISVDPAQATNTVKEGDDEKLMKKKRKLKPLIQTMILQMQIKRKE